MERLWFMRSGIGLGMEQKTGSPEKLVGGQRGISGARGSPGLELGDSVLPPMRLRHNFWSGSQDPISLLSCQLRGLKQTNKK